MEEKRGPIEKGEKGWPINPYGVAALAIFILLVIFLIVRPLIRQNLPEGEDLISAQIISPTAGEVVRGNKLPIKLSVDDPERVAKVQFWAKAYVDGSWEVIGEDESLPFEVEWTIPQKYINKAIVITSHVFDKNGKVTKDPGGWREGIIILSP